MAWLEGSGKPQWRAAFGILLGVRRGLVIACLSGLVFACGDGDLTSRPAEPPATPLIFTAHGLPGPWWKISGSPREFQGDSRECRSQSSRARERAAREALEVAYQAFLDCMGERMWQRGSPPNQPRAGA